MTWLAAYGSAEVKASVLLDQKHLFDKTFVALDPNHYFPFKPQVEADDDEYWSYPQIDTLFNASVDGIKTSRDGLVIANTHEKCRQKILAFANSTASLLDIEAEFSVSAKGFDIRRAQGYLSKHFDEHLIHPILYRPFDVRYIYYDKELILSHRMNVMPSMFDKQAWSLVFASRLSSKGFDHVIACSTLCAHKCASHDINSRMFPVVGLFEQLLEQKQLISNLSERVEKNMSEVGTSFDIDHASRFGEYLYALLNAPTYRARYQECISQDFPRAPLTRNTELFTKLSEQGRALVKLHTLAELPPDDVFPFHGSYDGHIISPKWKDGILTIGISSHIAGVEQDEWKFRMCGYDVCKSWFTAGWKAGIQREGEHLTQACVLQARTMLWTIRETLRIRRGIDELIEKFGGWPLK